MWMSSPLHAGMAGRVCVDGGRHPSQAGGARILPAPRVVRALLHRLVGGAGCHSGKSVVRAGTRLLLGALPVVVVVGGTWRRSTPALQTTHAPRHPTHLPQFCSTCSEPLFCFETAIKMLYFSFLVRLVDLTCGICCLPPRHLCCTRTPRLVTQLDVA